MGGTTMLRTVTTAGLMALMLATPAAAAQADAPEPETLEAQAEALAATGRDGYAEAAALYRKAAELRMEGDPQAVVDLMRAGKLSYYSGRHERAMTDLVRAADRALAYGDVLNAATAYLDAGWVAFTMGDGARAYDLAVKGARLSESPLIGTDERQALRRRVEGAFTS